MGSDDGPGTVMMTAGDHIEHRFNGLWRDADLTALGTARSVAKGGDGRGVLDSNWSSFSSVAGGGNDREQQHEHCFDGARRQVNLAPSGAAWSLARSAAVNHGDSQSVSGAATSVSKSTAATASMDNGWSGNGDDMVVVYERQDSEVTFSPQARQRRSHNPQTDTVERQSDVTATLSNDSAERRWQELMQRHGKRRRHASSSTTASDSSGDSEHDVQRLTSPTARKERQLSVVSPKQANGVITADKKSERNRTSESPRRETVRSPEQSVTATSKQKRSTERTSFSSAAAAVISSDSEADETEERRRHDTEKSGRVKDVDGARHSTQRRYPLLQRAHARWSSG